MAEMKPKLPKGWRFVKNGEIIEDGDRLINRMSKRWRACTVSIGLQNNIKATWIIRKIEAEPAVTSNNPPENRWRKFTGKAPKFTDPAEAEFEVRCHSNAVAKNCAWLCSTMNIGKSWTDYETFHTAEGMPILRNAISHWRRA